jgi:hypothetical protein
MNNLITVNIFLTHWVEATVEFKAAVEVNAYIKVKTAVEIGQKSR